MGLLSTLRQALGLQRPVDVHDGQARVGFTDAARARLHGLREGEGIHVEAVASDEGWAVRVTEGALQGPPPPELEDLPVTLSDATLERLRGLELDHRHGLWAVSLHLEIRARETPNPNSRLYMTNRLLAEGTPLFFSAESELTGLPERLLALPGVQAALFRDHTVTIERRADQPWHAIDAGVDAALRAYFLACGSPLTASDAPAHRDPLERAVWEVLQERILPGIHRDGGDLKLLGIQDGIVRLAMVGACRGCPASTMTLRQGVERTLVQAFPDAIRGVEAV